MKKFLAFLGFIALIFPLINCNLFKKSSDNDDTLLLLLLEA